MIFFSVIIPTYNRSRLLINTVNSVLSQNYSHFEVIIVDDGSTDDTGQVILDTYSNDLRVRYFYKQNEERGAARNFGMKQAKGSYAVIFDSDDFMHADYLAAVENAIRTKSNRPINFLVTKYQTENEYGVITQGHTYNFKEGWYGLNDILKGSSFGCLYIINLKNPNLIYFQEDRKYSILEDWLFLLENLSNDNIYLIDKVALNIHQHTGNSLTNNQKVISAKKETTKWAVNNIHLSPDQKKILLGWSHYFCSVHQYLDKKRLEAIKEALSAIKIGGVNLKFVSTLIKSIIGRSFINRIKQNRKK